MLTAELAERRTFQLERWRSVAAGITETANSTFLGVVAIQHFHASQTAKGILLTNTSLGLLLAPLILWFVGHRGWSASRGIAVFSAIAAVACAGAAVNDLTVFSAGSVIAYMAAAAIAPLYTIIYEANYRAATRGLLFSRNYFLRILSNIAFALVAGKLLQHNLAWYPWVLGAYAVCFAFSALVVSRMPAVRVEPAAGRNPLAALRHVRDDLRFRWTLVSWMFLGFANLCMFPLRTEYLAHERYGLRLDPNDVALYTAVIPNLARLCFNPIWGPLFDRMNFFNLRIILNTGFMLGFLSFFTASSAQDHFGLVLGAVLFGISNAGADVVWNLWVTKIATPDKTAEYMAVHSFLTGVRGVIAPILAFQLIATHDIRYVAFACAGLVIVASLLLWREKSALRGLPEQSELPEQGVE